MELNEIKTTIVDPLMKLHGLYGQGWAFEFTDHKSTYGACNHRYRLIKLSGFLAPLISPEAIRNTVLHEIAHALVGPGHGHDRVWEAKALEIGCDGKRCNDHETAIDLTELSPWVACCSACPLRIPRHKKPKPGAKYSHSGCPGEIIFIKNSKK